MATIGVHERLQLGGMSLHRRAALGLLSLMAAGILGLDGPSRSAHAAPNRSTARDPRGSSGAPLPRGVHQRANGRYVRDLCGEASARLRCRTMQLLPEGWQPGDSILDAEPPQPAPLSASIVAAAYHLPPTAQASGKIVAIIGAPDMHALADLTMHRSLQGLPAMERCSGLPTGTGPACFAQVAQDGGPSTNTSPVPAHDIETSLDTQMVSIACPDCSILLVEIKPSFCERDLVEGVATATRLGASAISISLGGPEATDPNALSVGLGGATNGTSGCPAETRWPFDLPGPFSTPGHLVFVSSADQGYNNENRHFTPTVTGAAPAYPASSPYVIAVGGTTLYADGSSFGEGVWSATTSGCSTEFAMPPWQASLLSGSTCGGRATADVSAAATFISNGTEVGIEIVFHGQTTSVVGTSASAPLVAAMFTRLGLTTEVSNDLSWVYKNSAAFSDVGAAEYPLPPGASSSNTTSDASCGILCTAGTGWDGPSGVGSPDGMKLAALPVSTDAPQPYPDSGICGPYGRVGAGGAIEACDDGGCACKVGGGRGRAPGSAWMVALSVLALLGARHRRRGRTGTLHPSVDVR